MVTVRRLGWEDPTTVIEWDLGLYGYSYVDLSNMDATNGPAPFQNLGMTLTAIGGTGVNAAGDSNCIPVVCPTGQVPARRRIFLEILPASRGRPTRAVRTSIWSSWLARDR